jgi:hypothetical protein
LSGYLPLRQAALAGAASLVALALGLAPAHLAHAGSACPSGGTPAPGSTVRGGLTVDGNCVISNVTIEGGVVVTGKGHLTSSGSTINGGVTVNPGGELDSGFPNADQIHGSVVVDHPFDLDIWRSVLHGSLTVIGVTAGPRNQRVIYTLCGITLHGTLTLDSLPAAPRGFTVGDPNEVDAGFVPPCAGNSITGSVHILNSKGSRIEMEGNTIGGSVLVSNSTPSLSGNTIGGSLSCEKGGSLVKWDADDTNINSVHGKNGC